jgi:hypothetical protein
VSGGRRAERRKSKFILATSVDFVLATKGGFVCLS